MPEPRRPADGSDEHLNQIIPGLETPHRFACIQGLADRVERDEPYQAIEIGMRYLDLTGTYRLLAVLCTA